MKSGIDHTSVIEADRLFVKAVEMWLKDDNNPEAFRLFRKAIKLDPTNHEYPLSFALWFSDWRKLFWLHRALKATSETHADYKYILGLIGDMHMERKKYVRAYQYYKRCISSFETQIDDLAKLCKTIILSGFPNQNELMMLLWFLRTRIKRYSIISSRNRSLVNRTKNEVRKYLSTFQFSKLREV